MSAVVLFVAKAILYNDAKRVNADISVWCPWVIRLSQKKINTSIYPWAIIAPIIWSPPKGPESTEVTYKWSL